MTRKKLRIIEFLLIGVGMGVIEDVIAIMFATEASIEWKVIWVVVAVAIPFAYISEVVVDHPRFWEKIFRRIDNNGDAQNNHLN